MHMGLAMGARAQRFSMVLDDGVVSVFHHEPDGRGLTCSLSNPLIASLDELPARE